MKTNSIPLRASIFTVSLLIFSEIFALILVLIYNNTSSSAYEAFLRNALAPTFLMHMVCFLIPSLIYIKIFVPKGEIKQTLRLNGFSARNLGYVILILFLTFPLTSLVSYVSSIFFGSTSEEILSLSLNFSFPVGMLVLAVTPSITEELIFRGIILSESGENHELLYAVLNGVLFGAMHGNLSQFFYAVLLGIVFYFIVKVTNSFYLAMISHFLINGSQVILMHMLYSSGSSEDLLTADTSVDISYILSFGFISLVFSILLYFLFKSFFKYNNYTVFNKTKYVD